MAFVVLLLLSITTFVQIEQRTAAGSLDRLHARQNALLGAMVAVGRLQSSLGPDQRVSSTAEILNSGSGIAHPNWTAAWRWDVDNLIDYDPATDPSPNADWLVSGKLGPDEAIPAADEVTLVGSSEVADVGDQIKVPAETIDGGSGRFAYWVGDEGVKARFNLVDPYAQLDPNSPLRHRVAQRTGVETFLPAAATTFDPNDPKNQRIISTNELELLDSELDILPAEAFHDITVVSESLLTNTLEGGLQTDLTPLFESDSKTNFRAFFAAAAPLNASERDYWLFRDDSGRIDDIGPNYGILREYYRLSKIRTNAATAINPIAPNPNKIDLNTYGGEWPMQTGGWPRGDEYHENSPVHPVMFLVQVSAGFEFIDNGLGGKKLRVKLMPVVGLYNPYNVSLAPADYSLRWGMQPNVTIKAASRTDPTTPITSSFHIYRVALGNNDPSKNSYSGTFINMETADPVGFGPGQIRYFAVNQPTKVLYDPALNAPDGDFNYAEIVSDSNATGYLYYDIEDARVGGSTSQEYTRLDAPEQAVLLDIDPASPIEGSFTYTNTEKVYYLQLGKAGSTQDIQTIPHLWDDEGDSSASSANKNNRKFSESTFSWPNVTSAAQAPSVATWAVILRTTNQPEYNSLRLLIDSNPRAMTHDVFADGFTGGRGYGLTGAFEVPSLSLSGDSRWGILGPNDAVEPEFRSDYNGLWGSFYTVSGEERVILFDVPSEPLVSVGELQHAPLSRYSYDPAYMLGNSYAPVRVPRNGFVATTPIKRNNKPEEHYIFDLSYLINQNFWDRNFFSTIDPDWSTTELAQKLAGTSDALPNSRLTASSQGADALETIALNATSSATSLRTAATQNAAYLKILGGFNINSTSVPAWEALLSSLNNLSIQKFDTVNSSSSDDTPGKPIFSRLALPYASGFEEDDGDDSDFWRGYRELTSSQITELATAIVAEVKSRGPFLTMGDFVNRALADDATGLSGTIQTALDATVNAFNPAAQIDNNTWTPTFEQNSSSGYFFDSNITDLPLASRAAGHAGYLMQGDLLQALAPVLRPRSDTFRVRGYGETRNPVTGKVAGKAICELIVQRQVEGVAFAASSGSAPDPSDELNRPSSPFGRQFKIIGVRWLDTP